MPTTQLRSGDTVAIPADHFVVTRRWWPAGLRTGVVERAWANGNTRVRFQVIGRSWTGHFHSSILKLV